MKPQQVSFFEPKKLKPNRQFHPVSRETDQKKKRGFLPKTHPLTMSAGQLY